MAPNDSKYLPMSPNGTKWLQIASNGSKWLKEDYANAMTEIQSLQSKIKKHKVKPESSYEETNTMEAECP